MEKQIHKRFSSDEVKEILERYIQKEINLEQAYSLLKIGRRRFFDLLRKYREKPDEFRIEYQRKTVNRQLDKHVDIKIYGELKKEAKLIADPSNTIQNFNYSFVKEVLAEKHQVHVSLPTIINRAKKMDFTGKRNSVDGMTGRF